MGRKKITVVNIDDNDTKNDDVVDVTEPTDKPIEIPEEVMEKKKRLKKVPRTSLQQKRHQLRIHQLFKRR